MGFWGDIRTKISNAREVIQSNPILDAFASSALESIPVVGGLLLRIYENSKDSPEDKTGYIIELLKKMEMMNEQNLQDFCRGLEQNKELILQNQEYLKQISQDTSIIISMLKGAEVDRKNIGDGVQRVENKIDFLFQMIQRMPLQTQEGAAVQPNLENQDSFVCNDFKIAWPNTWERVSKEELQVIRQGVDKIMNLDADDSINDDYFLIRKKTAAQFKPNIGLEKSTAQVQTGIFEIINYLIGNYEQNYKWSVLKADFDKISRTGTVEVEMNLVGMKSYMIQKIYLKNTTPFILTISQVSPTQLDEDPGYASELESILNSLVFLK